MRHSLIGFLSIFLLLFSVGLFAQTEAPLSPSVSSLMTYESQPVDFYTGTPNVSIPVYTMPTRSKDININIGLSYHPSSVAVFSELSGNCGRGWTLSTGGAISKLPNGDPDGNPTSSAPDNDGYQYNFMGFSGRFRFEEDSNGNLYSVITENHGSVVKISKTAGRITFYDDKGYKYIFTDSNKDTYIYPKSALNRYTAVSAYHLSSIQNPDEVALVTFNYQDEAYQLPYHQQGEYNHTKILQSITVHGVGTIEYDVEHYYPEDNYFFYGGVEVFNNKGTSIKRVRFNFDFLSPVKEGISTDIRMLSKVSITPEALVYDLTYKLALQAVGSSLTWNSLGFLNHADEYSNELYSSSDDNATSWVLEKMTLPTGGCVIYNYELNTYSYKEGVRLDWVENEGQDPDSSADNFWEIDSEFYQKYDYNNRHNFNEILHHNYSFDYYNPSTSFSVSFPVGGLLPVYIRFTATPFQQDVDNDGIDDDIYPNFDFDSGSYTFTKSNHYDNKQNKALGKQISSGSHTLTMTPINVPANAPSGTLRVYSMEPKDETDIKKWYRGGGIRIKNIAYFDTDEVASNYYRDPSEQLTYQPIREITYDYTLFDSDDTSSGNLVVPYPGFDLGSSYTPIPYKIKYPVTTPAVTYKNVTVYDSKDNGGYTEYTFNSAIDDNVYDPDELEELGNYQYRPIKTAIYNAADVLQQEDFYTYDFNLLNSNTSQDTDTPTGTPLLSPALYKLGRSEIRQSAKRFYHPNDMVETIDLYDYYGNHKLKRHTTYGSRTSETLKTEYFYDDRNAPFSQNRFALDTVKKYLNDELLLTSVINYDNDWADPEGVSGNNLSYLPASTTSAKGNNNFTTTITFNKYDEYGHAVEFEQENGLTTVYIWGYDESLIVAKIEGASYDAITPSLITAVKTASDTGTESDLLTALDNLRSDTALAEAMVTTYTHIPLVGVSTMTDARGYRTTYHYDSNHRLQSVTDEEGNILSENEYHINSQN